MRSRVMAALFVLAGALVTGGWLVERGLSGGETVVGRARLFDEVMRRVARDYVDSVSDSVLFSKATSGMLEELHDPYSVYLNPDRRRKLDETTTGTYAGIGVQIDVRDGWITVVSPLPGTPAERAGLETGDRVVTIDGHSTEGWTTDEALKSIRGRRGSTLAMVVERPGVEARLPFSITRADIRVHSVRHASMVDKTTGYVSLTVFSEESAADLRSAIDDLREQGMETLILDLRNNPGGLLQQGVEVSDLFLEPGQSIVTMRGRAPGTTRAFSDDAPQQWPSLRLVALVNGSSASASEILAGALQDHDRALIVGTTTYGKGSAQSVFPLPSGAALKLTTARWFTPSNRSIQKPQHVDDDSAGDADADTTAEPPLDSRAAFKTDHGRTVYGGGGITPDLIVVQNDTAGGLGALSKQLGKDIPRFRDALTEYALALRMQHRPASAQFTITPDMRNELWTRLQRRSVKLTRAEYDSAQGAVDRVMTYEIERYVFGVEAEFSRQLRDDRAMITALELSKGATSQDDLLARAAARRAAHREDVAPSN